MTSFTRIFVYGTLKTGLPNHFLLRDTSQGIAKFVCNGYTQEMYPLVVSSSAVIPFLLDLPGKGENVHGEIYEVDEQMLESLDQLESVGILYDRKELKVTTHDNDMKHIQEAHTYIMTKFKSSLLNLPFISNYDKEHAKRYRPKVDRDQEDNIVAQIKGE